MRLHPLSKISNSSRSLHVQSHLPHQYGAHNRSIPPPHQLVTPQSLSASSVTQTPFASREGARGKSLGREEDIASAQQLLPAPTGVAAGRDMNVIPQRTRRSSGSVRGSGFVFHQENTKHLLPVCPQPSPCPIASVLSPDSSSEHIHPTER